MKDKLEIPMQKAEDLVAANLRRDNYAHTRDAQAMEFNTAIADRLLAKDNSTVKCEKCGKEFKIESGMDNMTKCPECR
jgi:PHP family Zn ribbon phosphoesterase